MFDDDLRAEIGAMARNYAEPRGACIDAMRRVQQRQGYVSDEALAELAALLGMHVAELDSVATFYNQIFRRPVGRHVIHVCDSVVCWMLGAEGLREHLAQKYGVHTGETTADGKFTLLPVPCLGLCDRAPALLIDGERHEALVPARLDELLDRLP